MDVASVAATLAAVIALAWGANRLIGDAETYFRMGGGWEFVSYARQHATGAEGVRSLLPGLHVRAAWFGAAWICAVFGAGCGLLALAGARSLWWRVQGFLLAA
jgi:hypothetical protein